MSLPGITTFGLNSVAFTPDGELLLAAGGGMVNEGSKWTTLQERVAWKVGAFEPAWQVVQPAENRIAGLTVSPDSTEYITKSADTKAAIWRANSTEPTRTIPVEFLCGDLVYSPDGRTIIAPASNELALRSSASGRISKRIELSPKSDVRATAASFLATNDRAVVACRVYGRKTPGLLAEVDLVTGKVARKAALEVEPDTLATDPAGSWICVAGRRKNRGHVLFWGRKNWKQIGGGGAHGSGVDDVKVSPDGRLVATCGSDNVIRLWSTENWKTVAKLEQHLCEGSGTSGLAWSPDGRYLAYANAAGAPPAGGVYVYQVDASRLHFELVPACKSQTGETSEKTQRHIQVWGKDGEMDTYGNFNVPANDLPQRCSHCTFPDIDAVAEPYLLRRGVESPVDFSTAQLGNFLVRDELRHILEVVGPGMCKYYSTANYKDGATTAWHLAVPQTIVATAQPSENSPICKVCGEPKKSWDLQPLELEPVAADIFKPRHWLSSQTGEEAKWYWMHVLKLKAPPKVRQGQWTRIAINRELWFSVRLVLLLKELGIKGFPFRDLEQRRATESEADWIAEQSEKLKLARTSPQKGARKSASANKAQPSDDTASFLSRFLKDNASKRPLATAESLRAWSKKHGVSLPKDYQRFAKKIGRKTFRNLAGMEGLDVRIVGPKQLDCESFRCDPPAEPGDPHLPDGLMFAVAVNGDCLCFDLAANTPDYPVYYVNHETEEAVPYANNFAAAVRRLTSGE